MKPHIIFRALLSLWALGCAGAAAAQSPSVTGTVTDENGVPLVGVTVTVPESTVGTITDVRGEYTIAVPDTSRSLLFSYIGYRPVSEAVGSRTRIDVRMQSEATGIDEVVVMGYGVQRRSDVTSAVAVIKTDELPSASSASLGSMLQGRAAGLSVQQTSASPGGALNFSVRGSESAPLIVVDGIPMTALADQSLSASKLETGSKLGGMPTDTNFINLNPDDIESIDVLKDASATAIYGSRAANGVVLITTKRGKEGRINVSFSASGSVQKLYGMPEMLSGQEYMIERNRMARDVYMNANGFYPYGTREWNDFESSKIKYPYTEEQIRNFTGGTDWLDQVTRLGYMHNESLNITGGSEKTKYLFSVSNLGNEAVMKNNSFNRFTTRLNLDQTFNKWLKGSVSLSYSRNRIDNIFGESGRSAGAQFAGVIASALEFDPLLSVRDENGDYTINPLMTSRPNPVSFLEAKDQSQREALFGSASVEITPVRNLSIRATFGADIRSNDRNSYLPSTVLISNQINQYAYMARNRNENYIYNVTASYNFAPTEGLDLSLMAGFEFEDRTETGSTMANAGFPSDDLLWNNMGSGSAMRPEVSSYKVAEQRASWIGRLTMNYRDRYLLTFNLRADGSSNFAKNKQWGVFPGVSVGWRLSEEPFLKDSRVVSNLKIRGGYGLVGNDGKLTGSSLYFTTSYYAFNKVPTAGLGIASIGNPDLSWETKTSIDAGIDFGFFNNRLTGSVDFYSSRIRDIIGVRELPINQEVATMDVNLGQVDGSHGVDISLSSVNVRTRNFRWTTNVVFSWYRNFYVKRDPSYVLQVYEKQRMDKGDVWYCLVERIAPGNRNAGSIVAVDTNGILRDAEGNPIILNGKYQYSGAPDGLIDEADYAFMCNNTPMPFSLNNTFEWRNFDLTVYIYGMFHNWQRNATWAGFATSMNRVYLYEENTMADIRQRFSYDNVDSDVPGYFTSGNDIQRYFYERAWFLRLDNVTLGYTLPRTLTRRAGINSVRFYVTARNLCVLTPYSGSDPETDSRAAYPNQRTFTAGVELKF